MKRNALLLLALLTIAAGALAGVSFANGARTSGPTVKSGALAPSTRTPVTQVVTNAAPSYCNPCLFYSGDLNLSDPSSDALQNGNDPVFDGAVYQAVKPDNEWLVTAIIVNAVNGSGGVLDPATTPWEIRTGMGPNSGDAGVVYASGSGTGTSTSTGRTLIFPEYAVKVTLTTPVLLHAGVTYFVNARPQCTNGGNAACTAGFSSRWFQSNVKPAGAPLNHFGPANVDNDNFWNSTSFAADFIQAWPAPYPCFAGCEQFSVALQGTLATGTLEVIKDLHPAYDPARFNLRIDGATYEANAGDGDTTGPVTILYGYHTVSETAGIHAVLSKYVTHITCTDGSSGYGTSLSGVYVAPGDSVTCTIRNDRKLYKV